MPLLRNRRSIAVSDEALEMQRAEEEARRVKEVERRRLYVEGRQYDKQNEVIAETLQCDPKNGDPLPEHRRLHAYSTQIGECIDFLADRLGEGFVVDATATPVQAVVDDFVAASDQLSAPDQTGDVEVVTDDLLREALAAGDVAVYVGWDPIEETVYPEFYESEQVEFVMPNVRTVEKVIKTDVRWQRDDMGTMREVVERHEYEMAPNEAGVMECRRSLYWDEEEDPRETEWLGVGRIPWRLLRADARKIRATRGESVVTDQAMGTADRYNAVEQVAWLIARYNSHGNLAVTGDGANLKLETDGRLSKDVADVLTFPGGTNLQAITLPTDAQMIEHQRGVLADALYHVFGLTRVESDTLQGLGGVTGYALEILNQKSEATFKRIARRWRADFLSMLMLALDVYAWKSQGPVGVLNRETLAFEPYDDAEDIEIVDEAETAIQAWWQIDPSTVFPNRKIEVRMGSGYIVDDVMVRDDFIAELISRQEALRRRGYDEPEIKKIMGEIEAEAEKQTEGTLRPGESFGQQAAGGTVGVAERSQA